MTCIWLRGKSDIISVQTFTLRAVQDTLLEVIQGRINNIQNYPSPSAEELNVLAAKQWNLSADQFLFTNGATEAFYLLGHLFSKNLPPSLPLLLPICRCVSSVRS